MDSEKTRTQILKIVRCLYLQDRLAEKILLQKSSNTFFYDVYKVKAKKKVSVLSDVLTLAQSHCGFS